MPLKKKTAEKTLLDKVKSISPTDFENLVFDLMVLSGLKNAIWRTPGPDAGRDIQGQIVRIDHSDQITLETWYIECKKYSKTVDWPTVYEKVTYADNHDADFLLIVTTGILSPRCKEEIQRRETSRKTPHIRFWEGAYLDIILQRHPILLLKYGFLINDDIEGKSILPLMNIASKAIQAAYGVASWKSLDIKELEFSAALIELVLARIRELKEYGKVVFTQIRREVDLFDWLVADDDVDLCGLDSCGIRAILCATRLCSKSDKIELHKSKSAIAEIKFEGRKSTVLDEIVQQIMVWSNLNIRINKDKLFLDKK